MDARETSVPTAGARRSIRLPLFGFLLTLIAPVVYLVLLDVPALRATGGVGFAFAGLGCLTGFAGVFRGTNRRGYILAGFNVFLVALYVAAFFLLAALPATPAKLMVGEPVPSFELSDQNGQRVSLGDAHAEGPALVVFYRGSW